MEPLDRAKNAYDKACDHFVMEIERCRYESALLLATTITRLAEAIYCLSDEHPKYEGPNREPWE